MSDIVVERIPSLTCAKCGGIRVYMTDNGPECAECDAKPEVRVDLTEDLEYFLYQVEPEE